MKKLLFASLAVAALFVAAAPVEACGKLGSRRASTAQTTVSTVQTVRTTSTVTTTRAATARVRTVAVRPLAAGCNLLSGLCGK